MSNILIPIWACGLPSAVSKVNYVGAIVHLKGYPRLRDVTLHVQANIVLAH